MEEIGGEKIALKFFRCFKKVNPSDGNDFLYCCEIEECGKQINGKKESNLGSHLKRKHNFFYKKNIAKVESVEEPLETTRLKFVQNCAEIVAVSGRPFRMLNDPGRNDEETGNRRACNRTVSTEFRSCENPRAIFG